MTFLPIVERELRVASRSFRTYWSRVGTAFAATLVGGWALFTMSQLRGMPMGGKELFTVLSSLSFYSSFLAGAASSADSISRERREGTLGLLFLTDLNGYDIIFGKLAAGSLISFYALFATFPVLAMPLMLGGVTWPQFTSVMLALINSLFFSHAGALFISTGQREAQKAISTSVAFLLFMIIGIPALQFIPAKPTITVVLKQIAMFSPGYTFAQAAFPFRGSFWSSLLLSNLLGWIFLASASYRAAHCWKEKAFTPIGWRARWRQWILGSPEFRLTLRRQLLDRSAYLWLISRGRFRKIGIWIGFSIVILSVSVIHVLAHDEPSLPEKGELLMLIFAIHIVVKVAVATESSRYLDAQKRNGELEMLLSSTPIRNEDVFHAHWLALKRLYQTPFIFLLGIDLLAIVLGCLTNDSAFSGLPAALAYSIAVVGAIGMLFFDVWALRWVGLWMGVSSRRPGHGTGAAFARIFAIPLLVFGFCQIPLSLLRLDNATSFFVYGFTWLLVCIVNNLSFVAWAKHQLQTDLRVYILPHGEEPLTLLGRLGRLLGKAVRPFFS